MAESSNEQMPRMPDPQQMAESFAQIAQQSQRLVNDYFERQLDGKIAPLADDLGLNNAFMNLGISMLTNPWKMAEAQMKMWNDYAQLWQNSMQKMNGEETAPVAQPAKSDNRFRSELWHNNFVFDYIKQSYLIASQNIQKMVSDSEGLDPQTARKVQFFTRQFVDALAPTNFAFTNPDVLKATMETGGKNLVDGLQHLLHDMERGKGQLAISMTDYKAFKLGENVATTPGKIVFENAMMQLIQYVPTTETVARTPLLIIPPWINKYYILDLREKNSFIRWAVAQGQTVFVISWVNPDHRLADKTFEDYMQLGPMAALDAIEQATGEHEANVIGYCLGGTLLASFLAWLAAKGEKRVKSATFFTAMIDFREPGELGVFADETTLLNLEKKMLERGYLEGAEMAGTFNLLRANDLIWSFVVNNYLLGKEPFPFDLLYWNSDATRMPAKMHAFYIRNMYVENRLIEPGGITLSDVPIDLKKIQTPAFFLSTVEDHIAPWKSTYMGTQFLGGPVKFVLAGSGHIAGVVNPPAANKYFHWVNAGLPKTADEGMASAARHDGSWWPEWDRWVGGFGGGKVPARVPGEGKLKVIEDAPGAYVKLRLDPAAPGLAAATATVEVMAAALTPLTDAAAKLAEESRLAANEENDDGDAPPPHSGKSKRDKSKRGAPPG